MHLEGKIKEQISEGFKTLFEAELKVEEIKLQATRKEFKGHFTFVTFPFSRISKKSPEETGKALGEWMYSQNTIISDYNIVKGFLNLEITDQTWLRVFEHIWGQEHYGFNKQTGEEVMVEYSSPNTNKPLHLGHLRNIFLGYSVAKILEANGCKVHKVQIINDRGIHICKSMLAWQKFGNGETPESSGIKGDHLVGKYYVLFEKHYRQQVGELVENGQPKEEAEKNAPLIIEAQEMLKKWEQKDKEVYHLWETMNQWVYQGFDATYQKMGVDFDKLYYESDTFLYGKEKVLAGLEKDIFFKKADGSSWVDLSDEGLDQKILIRSDGTSVYVTQDIGTAIFRFKDFPNISRLIYTVGNEQEYHFKVLFLILKKLGYQWADGLYHLAYGMVDLPSGKMKSREGTVVDADDLVDEMILTAERKTRELGKIEGFDEEQAIELYHVLGLGAIKYFLLKVDPLKRMLFNPEESIELHGNTGPFIQYTHARISAIIRTAKEKGIVIDGIDINIDIKLNEYEREVLYQINDFANKVKESANEISPSVIAKYVYDLAKEYNKFYAEISIFNEPDQDQLRFRVMFSYLVARTIKDAMGLLGIEVPKRM